MTTYTEYMSMINEATTYEEITHIQTLLECDRDISDEEFDALLTASEERMDEVLGELFSKAQAEMNSYHTDADRMEEAGMTLRDF